MAISRDMYKKLKGMNRLELGGYLNRLYANGHNDGVLAVTSKLVERIDNGVRNTVGIGEKRHAEIMTNISIELNKESEE